RSGPLRGTFSASRIAPPCCENPCRCTATSIAPAETGISFQRRNRSGWVPAWARSSGWSPRYASPGWMLSPEMSIAITRSRRREQALLGRGAGNARALRQAAADEGGVALQYRQYPVGEKAHVDFGLLVRHRAERILGDEVVETGQALQLADLVEAIIGRADDLDADVKICRLLPRLG